MSIVASCPKVKQVLTLVRQIAETNATVLIQGETGTGKDIIAREIHRKSGREGPFIVVNCGAIPQALIESELFGYEKGAFTGANQKGHKGKFEAAHGGTLFLDEIGELPLASQVVLLRAIEEKRITRIGSHEAKSVDVRIIAATNRDLVQAIKQNRFRADLYYRLNEIEVKLPPLRERSDLPLLIDHFLNEIAAELHIRKPVIDQSAVAKLARHPWPGNIRELRHVIRQAVYHVHFVKRGDTVSEGDIALSSSPGQKYDQAVASEKETIAQAIRQAEGNLSKAAKRLHIGRTTLYRKLKQYPELLKIRDEYRK